MQAAVDLIHLNLRADAYNFTRHTHIASVLVELPHGLGVINWPQVVIFTPGLTPSPRGDNRDSNATERAGGWDAFHTCSIPRAPMWTATSVCTLPTSLLLCTHLLIANGDAAVRKAAHTHTHTHVYIYIYIYVGWQPAGRGMKHAQMCLQPGPGPVPRRVCSLVN